MVLGCNIPHTFQESRTSNTQPSVELLDSKNPILNGTLIKGGKKDTKNEKRRIRGANPVLPELHPPFKHHASH